MRFAGMADTDQALVLSNGHCLPTMPAPNTYVADRAVTRSATILGGEDAHKLMTITLDRLLYATMTGTDVGEKCTINNPCEVDEAGPITVIKGQPYAQQTYPLAAWYSAGTIDLTRAGCTLFGAHNTPTPTPTPGGNLVTNPGFESGTQGWTGTSGPITNSPRQGAHSGQWKLWLGGHGSLGTETIGQNVTIPADAGRTIPLTFTATEDANAQTSFVVDDVALTIG